MAEGGTDSILGCWEKLGHVWGKGKGTRTSRQHWDWPRQCLTEPPKQSYQAGEAVLGWL